MADTIYILVAVTGAEGEAAAVAAIENLDNAEQSFGVLEAVIDDDEGTQEATIVFLDN